MNILDTEYSNKFDELRKSRVELSYYKYGPVKENYSKGRIDALKSLDLCIKNTMKLVTQNIYAMQLII